jgi:hypothetical protein
MRGELVWAGGGDGRGRGSELVAKCEGGAKRVRSVGGVSTYNQFLLVGTRGFIT